MFVCLLNSLYFLYSLSLSLSLFPTFPKRPKSERKSTKKLAASLTTQPHLPAFTMRPNSQDLRENGYHDALLPFVSSSLIASPPTAPAAPAPVTAQPAAASTSEAPTWTTQAVD